MLTLSYSALSRGRRLLNQFQVFKRHGIKPSLHVKRWSREEPSRRLVLPSILTVQKVRGIVMLCLHVCWFSFGQVSFDVGVGFYVLPHLLDFGAAVKRFGVLLLDGLCDVIHCQVRLRQLKTKYLFNTEEKRQQQQQYVTK